MPAIFSAQLAFGKEMTSFVKLSTDDNVVTATKTVNAGVIIEGNKTQQSVPSGHKIAACDIKKGTTGHQIRTMHRFCVV